MFVFPMDRPLPTFLALRAATLALDDLDRQCLRAWLGEAIDHRGNLTETPAANDPLLRLFAAALSTLPERERQAFRQWVLHWCDYSGRIITPGERRRRLEEHQHEYQSKQSK